MPYISLKTFPKIEMHISQQSAIYFNILIWLKPYLHLDLHILGFFNNTP